MEAISDDSPSRPSAQQMSAAQHLLARLKARLKAKDSSIIKWWTSLFADMSCSNSQSVCTISYPHAEISNKHTSKTERIIIKKIDCAKEHHKGYEETLLNKLDVGQFSFLRGFNQNVHNLCWKNQHQSVFHQQLLHYPEYKKTCLAISHILEIVREI